MDGYFVGARLRVISCGPKGIPNNHFPMDCGRAVVCFLASFGHVCFPDVNYAVSRTGTSY